MSNGTPYYVPSYLGFSTPDDFRRLADSMPHVGPLRFRDALGPTYTPSKRDLDWVIRFNDSGYVTVAPDAVLEADRIPVGAQVAFFNASEGRVIVTAAPGVTVVSGDAPRLVIDKWKVGILVKTGANFWLLGLGSGSGGGGSAVPLPPKLVSCFGISAGASLAWTKPTDDGGSPITQYIVEGSADGSTWASAGFTQPDTFNLTVNALQPGKEYLFRVKALNSTGASEPSNVLAATPASEFNAATGGATADYVKDGRRFRVHTFTANDTINVTKAANPFRVLAVGGGTGGSGGQPYCKPGSPGASGQAIDTALVLPVGATSVTVGGVGADSTILTVDAKGAANTGRINSDITGTPASYPAADGAEGPCRSDGTQRGGDGTFPGGAGGGGGGIGNESPFQPGPGGAGAPGAVYVSYEIAPYNEATGGDEINEYSDGEGNRWRFHRFIKDGILSVTNAVSPFRVFVQGGGAGGGYGRGGGRGAVNDTTVELSPQAYQITVGAAVTGGYSEHTNRDAPGNNGQRSAIEGVIASPGGVSRGDYYAPGATTNITGTPVTYGGAGGNCVINEDRNEGGFPGGGVGGSDASSASVPGGGGGGCQWSSGGGARGEVIVAYRIKNPDGFQKATAEKQKGE